MSHRLWNARYGYVGESMSGSSSGSSPEDDAGVGWRETRPLHCYGRIFAGPVNQFDGGSPYRRGGPYGGRGSFQQMEPRYDQLYGAPGGHTKRGGKPWVKW